MHVMANPWDSQRDEQRKTQLPLDLYEISQNITAIFFSL